MIIKWWTLQAEGKKNDDEMVESILILALHILRSKSYLLIYHMCLQGR